MHLALIHSFVQPRNVRALRSFEGDYITHIFLRLIPSVTPLSMLVRSIGKSKHAAPNRDVVLVPFHEEGFGIIVKS